MYKRLEGWQSLARAIEFQHTSDSPKTCHNALMIPQINNNELVWHCANVSCKYICPDSEKDD